MGILNWKPRFFGRASGSGEEPPTDWHVIRAATRPVPEGTVALEKLCRTYWIPIYAYIRRCGYGPEDAQDLTQDFFAHLLSKSRLLQVHPSKGRFRSFLLASVNHFLANERRHGQAQKRGGGSAPLALHALLAEEQYQLEAVNGERPDKLFERSWAITVLKQAEHRLRQECVAASKADLFEGWEAMFEGEKHQHKCSQIATRLGTSEAAVRKASQRLRERFIELLRAEVAEIAGGPVSVDEEMRNLFAALRG